MKQRLEAIGSRVAAEEITPIDPPSSWMDCVGDHALDFLCRAIDFVPGDDLSDVFGGSTHGTGQCELRAFGSLAASGTATLWARNLPALAETWILVSSQSHPVSLPIGTIVPDLAMGGILALQAADDSGHLALSIPGGVFSGSVCVQLAARDTAGHVFFTNAFRLTFP